MQTIPIDILFSHRSSDSGANESRFASLALNTLRHASAESDLAKHLNTIRYGASRARVSPGPLKQWKIVCRPVNV